MNLSTGLSSCDLSKLVRNSHVRMEEVPIYDALAKVSGDLTKLSWEVYKEVVISHAEAGVDYITVHAGILQNIYQKLIVESLKLFLVAAG